MNETWQEIFGAVLSCIALVVAVFVVAAVVDGWRYRRSEKRIEARRKERRAYWRW